MERTIDRIIGVILIMGAVPTAWLAPRFSSVPWQILMYLLALCLFSVGGTLLCHREG